MEDVKKQNENLGEQTVQKEAIDNSPQNNLQEEIKKINDRIDNVLMQLTINNNKTVEEEVKEKDEELDF